MYDVMGVINLGEEHGSLEELTYYRNQASVPFAGKYRLIDFTLSNMVNSGIQDIAILAKNKYRSIMDHLGTGKEWDLDRRRGGLFILPPSFHHSNVKGDLQFFHQHLEFFIRGHQQYVLISAGHIIANVDYRPAFHFHKQMNADITVIYQDLDNNKELSNWRKIAIDDNGRVRALENKIQTIHSDKVSMEIFIMEKALLLEMIDTCTQDGECHVINSIIKNIEKLHIYGYSYQGYTANIDSIKSYYKHSMDMLSPTIWQDLFYQPRLIYTKAKNDPPARYLADSNVTHAFIGNGCKIEGKVENSILFRGVKIHKGAYIKDSIIMQNSEIGENAVIEHAILDKRTVITSGKHVIGEPDQPFVVSKRMRI